MKVGLFSDIHCKLPGLLGALEQLDDCDELLCAGDILYQYRFSNEVLAALKRRGVHSILGNHDKVVLHAPNHPLRDSPSVDPAWLAYLASLPSSLALTLGGVRIHVFHGSPWDDAEGRITPYIYPQSSAELRRLAEIDADVIVLGHTHVPFAHDTGHALVVNPGSCAEPRDGTPSPCCAVLDTDSLHVEFRRYEIPAGTASP